MSKETFKISGLAASSYLYFIAKHFKRGLIIVPSNIRMDQARDALAFFLEGAVPVYTYPSLDRLYEHIRQEPEHLRARLKTQAELVKRPNENCFIIASPSGLSQKTIPPKTLRKSFLSIKKAEFLERDRTIDGLQSMGYRRDEIAEDLGFFSVRGHLIDIFSPFDTHPYRIEFFGDEVLSIRTFDPVTQRSLAELNEIQIVPARELLLHHDEFKDARIKIKDFGDEIGVARDERDRILSELEQRREVFEPRWLLPAFEAHLADLFDYLPKDFEIITLNGPQLVEEREEFWRNEDKAYQELKSLAYPPENLRTTSLDLMSKEHHQLFTSIAPNTQVYESIDFDQLRPRLVQAKSFSPILEVAKDLSDRGISLDIVFENDKRREALYESLPEITKLARLMSGPLFEGFQSKTFSRALLNEKDIFGTKKRRATPRQTTEDFLRQFSDLNDGDFVIHEDHGVAKFRGLQKLTLQTVTSEFLVLEYADSDKLYLPIYRVDKIARYVSEGFANPKLDKLGTQNFAKKKARARRDILSTAHELLKVAAERKLNKVQRPDEIDMKEFRKFCDEFPYELTGDQESAILEITDDLKKSYPMDRLVCGDVGFGKTEVAMRAAMLSLLQGKQVCVLAPTTLLVEQHFRTFSKRFAKLKFNIGHLSRFLGPREQKKIVDGMRAGSIDIVIGTHRLFQPDIEFKNLGLMIVDEEQRFGVKHKERLKKFRSTVDVLTLSATPIPRTLQMSIFGIRELALITTPPESREAVKTYVGTFDETLIRNACLKERERGGQILFVHNRVQTIDGLAQRLKKLLPEIRIVVGHGQMREEELEKVMLDFIEERADLLLATTIIENGIDIPNANTLFVDHAEYFGLSDLYQLRGRVGRSHRSSTAYFLIREETQLTPEASKRLQVIQSCTALGSGFNVATHDLEIRGSGNLLGEEQSGLIAEVGMELYSQMLQETLAELKNEGVNEPMPELNSGYTAYIPDTYIPDASLRISTYRKLDRAKSPNELLKLEEEILDRFGMYPKEVETLCELLRIRALSYPLSPVTVDCFPGRLTLTLSPKTPLEPSEILSLVGKEVALDPKGRLTFLYQSALQNPQLASEPKFQNRPEFYDFSICRRFLIDLLQKAKIAVENL